MAWSDAARRAASLVRQAHALARKRFDTNPYQGPGAQFISRPKLAAQIRSIRAGGEKNILNIRTSARMARASTNWRNRSRARRY